ncbi:MAG: peroxiredoxin [Xanthomonadales bacterium]|nr:peroxiredoxin [Xanthomonadales bacterium]
MTISVGERIPDVEVRIVKDGVHTQRTGALFDEGKVVLFSVPGAFTPTCSNQHLPGYVHHFDAFVARGIRVVCMAVNDAFVMQAWAQAQQVPDGLLMLADGNAVFAQALGLCMDASGFGMGQRAQRFALLSEDGRVSQLHIEAPGEFKVSSAEAMLAALA